MQNNAFFSDIYSYLFRSWPLSCMATMSVYCFDEENIEDCVDIAKNPQIYWLLLGELLIRWAVN